jgi:hypothetical protein
MCSVLIPVDVQGVFPINPFVSELILSIQNANCVVDHGLFNLNTNRQWDVINFQWPEYILPEADHTQNSIDRLSLLLTRLKAKSKIVFTVHNTLPHYYQEGYSRELYRTAYSYADGFVHMGEESINIMHEEFYDQVKGKKHVIIPHGNYSVFGRPAKMGAESRMDPSEKPSCVVLGAVRHKSEIELIKESARIFSNLGGNFLFSSFLRVKKSSPRKIHSLVSRIHEEAAERLLLNQIKKINGLSFQPGPVSAEKIPDLISNSDILLIPRLEILNSGNLPLGFTYGCVVIGPDSGNVGEILKKTGNPTFDPKKPLDTLNSAFESAMSKVSTGVGKKNALIAHSEWDWRGIGIQYRDFYNSLLSSS